MGIIRDIYDILKEAWPRVQRAVRKRRVRRLTEALESAQSAIEKTHVVSFLRWKYQGERVLERCGYTYPVVIYPAPEQQWVNVESALGSLQRNPRYAPEDFAVYDPKYRNLISSLGLLLLAPSRDTITYTMRRLTMDGRLSLDCELGTYFQALDTCEALEWEIRSKANRLVGDDERAFRDFDSELHLRRVLHERVSNPVVDGSGRSAAIGVSTLLAFNDGSSFQLLLRRRAKRGVPLRAGLLHVVPSFMFAPSTIDLNEEFSVRHNVFREYLEELFSYRRPEREGDHKYFYGDRRYQHLKDLLSRNEAELLFTGVAVNLLNLRPEICTLLLIRTEEWYKACYEDPRLGWCFNDEFATVRDLWLSPEELVGRVSLADDDEAMLRNGSLYPSRTVPPGAAAFWLGVDVLRRKL